jgi:uncharacterized protein
VTKQRRLDGLLQDLGSVLVAYSGGVDSSYLALRAHQLLGARALAVTADSESLPEWQRRQALDVAGRFGFAHRLVSTHELSNPLYAQNAPDRCFHCKSELFARLVPLAAGLGLAHVAYGAIVDDLQDYRPGHRAAAAAGARAPLAEAGLTKSDVRELSRALGLPTWDAPASPCLSSRVAYGVSVTPPVLRQIERAEDALRALGFRELRVRHLGGGAARVELGAPELARLQDAALRARVLACVAEAGYAHVTIDASGYRRGSLNDALRDGLDSGVSSAHDAR